MAAGNGFRRALALLRTGAFQVLTEVVRLVVRRGRDDGGCLVLKLDALGDHVLWLSSGAQEVAAHARGLPTRTVLLTRQELAPLLADVGLFDEVWPLDTLRFRRSPLYRAGFQARLRRRGFSRVWQMRIAREFLLEDALVRAAAAPETCGVLGDRHSLQAREARHSDGWYRPLCVVPGEGEHELERNRRATVALTGREPATFSVVGRAPVQAPVLRAPYYVLAPGAGSTQRQWPPERFLEVANYVRAMAPSLRCVVVGTAAEAALGARVAEGGGALDLCGRLSMAELVWVIGRSMFVVANESAPGHIAAHTRVPSVVILGGGHHGWFMPYPPGWEDRLTAPRVVTFPMACFGCNWNCRYTRSRVELAPCVRDVAVAAVIREISALLAERVSPVLGGGGRCTG